MIVVADTSPINYLVRIELIGILPQLYGTVIIPSAVLLELRAEGSPAAVVQWADHLPDWIKVDSTELPFEADVERLGAGERAAITLATQIGASLVLVDDLPARRAVKRRGLVAAGTLAVLKDADEARLANFENGISELQKLGFRMTTELVEEIRRG
jgi:predicted nucleic acid-binding protein